MDNPEPSFVPPDQRERVRLVDSILLYNKPRLRTHITQKAQAKYKQERKTLQVDAVSSLVKGRNTFVQAGTGFRKSRISEMFLELYQNKKKEVVLVLHPLDALGDNQVEEKEVAGFSVINLTKMQFNRKTALQIRDGVFNFVYLSPEVFLNSALFKEVYYDEEFQDRLALIVIDEAHMIYSWGLVDSGKAKKSSAHKRTEDRSIFRPSYGDMGGQLSATEGVPILLLSATCRPVSALEPAKLAKRLLESSFSAMFLL
ncbi:ATP-dependent DNA helicase sgs1 [Puccinia graminis f. sp. tritici]|uniref:DNA 3'-5' helicase n=1 Tax=Puccinia graminis f. sp. tritici TaxID=56615 RepID=A0A5B0LJH7_PUCGR|nr:ATP-dependent DNA helicase sgs1 [Puccinia graminis f. sp. tritici]KAA1086018.1 ATP-dependent DNA helicase sgs1 [Puccinia graminis f. sp. tritici]